MTPAKSMQAQSDMNFTLVSTKAELDTLDHDEIVRGYMEYEKGDPEPGENRGKSYWHGWRNAAIDHYEIPTDSASASLAHELYPRKRA